MQVGDHWVGDRREEDKQAWLGIMSAIIHLSRARKVKTKLRVPRTSIFFFSFFEMQCKHVPVGIVNIHLANQGGYPSNNESN